MLAKRLLRLLEDAFTLGVVLASDAIDSWSSQETRQHLLQRLQDAVQRGSELALENASLKDEIQALRFSGPALYKDEVAALECAASYLGEYRDQAPTTPRYVAAIEGLIDRCDHLPMTSDDMAVMITDAINGRLKDFNWDDAGRDVDEEREPCNCGWDFNYGDTCPHGQKGQGA